MPKGGRKGVVRDGTEGCWNAKHHFEQNFHHGHVGCWAPPFVFLVGFVIMCVRVFEFHHWLFKKCHQNYRNGVTIDRSKSER